MGYDSPKIPANPRCSDHPTKSGRAKLSSVIWVFQYHNLLHF